MERTAEGLQTEVYEIGKRHPFPELRAWFKALYEVLLGQDQGPRFGSFIALYGRKETAELIRKHGRQAVLDSIDAMIDRMRERRAANAAVIADTAGPNDGGR